MNLRAFEILKLNSAQIQAVYVAIRLRIYTHTAHNLRSRFLFRQESAKNTLKGTAMSCDARSCVILNGPQHHRSNGHAIL